MKKVLIIALLFVSQLTVSAKNNTLTEKFNNWFQQQKSQLTNKLDQSEAQKNGLEKSIKGVEEKLSLLKASNSSIQTKLPLLKKLNSYKEELAAIDQKIANQEEKLNNINLSEFTESSDFQLWMKELDGLTTAEKMAVEKEVAQVGEMQQSIKSIEQLLLEKNISWEEMATASNWEDLWMEEGSEDAQKIQASISKVISLKDQVKNIDLNRLMEEVDMKKISSITDNKLNLPIETSKLSNQLENGFDLDETLQNIELEKSKHLKSIANKYKVTEIDHKEYKEVVFKKKPELKDMMFMEADVSLLKSDRTLVNASTIFGMQLSKRFALGLGTSYQNVDGLNQNLQGLWSGRLMTRVNVFKDIVALQFEGLSSIPSLSEGSEGDGVNFSQLIGTRFSMPSDSKLPLNMTLLHNLNGKVASPAYSAPWQMKFGISF